MYAAPMTWGGLKAMMLIWKWAPVTYIKNHRRKVNFIKSRAVGFDFDDGDISLDDMISLLKEGNFTCYVGLTKSHQREKKGKPPCDRFRVALLMSDETDDSDVYYQEMKFFAGIWMTNGKAWFDTACMDAARLFNPCTEIVFEQLGEPLEWVKKKEKPVIHRQVSHNNPLAIPDWLLDRIMDARTLQVGRSHSVYWISRSLGDLGWSQDDTYTLIKSGFLGDLEESRFTEACRNGWTKGTAGECTQSGRKNCYGESTKRFEKGDSSAPGK